MSKHPTERIRSVQEIQAKASLDSDKALRRVALAEERLARVEGRLAERDELIAEFREAYGRQADTISALSAVVRELESKVGRGVDQVLTGLEERIEMISASSSKNKAELDARMDHYESNDRAHAAVNESFDQRLRALESKPKRGRPKGSKNKPKSTPAVEKSNTPEAAIDPYSGDSSNPEASEDK